MPMIHVDYDEAVVPEADMQALAKALKDIVAEATEIPETSVYADSPKIRVNVAPIEVFVEMSTGIIPNLDTLFADIRQRLVVWKKENNFSYPITITVTPMHWKFDVDIQ